MGICELLPGLTEYEARQMIQKVLGRIPEATIKQILRQTGNSIRRLCRKQMVTEWAHTTSNCGKGEHAKAGLIGSSAHAGRQQGQR